MAFCTKCGEQNTDTAQFCVKCGNQMGAARPQASGSVASSESKTFIVELIKSLYPGSKTICIGAIVVIISFFLPYWGGGSSSYSGMNSGGWWWLIPIYALVVIGLSYLTHIGGVKEKLFSAAATIAIGMIYAPDLTTIFKGGPETSGLGIGFYGINLGFLAIVVGGFLNIWTTIKELEA